MPSAWQIRAADPVDWRTTAGLANLHLVHDIPKPKPSPGSALVRIHAASLNARDMMVIAHHPIYPIKTAPDLTPCADGAGVVEAVGSGSTFSVGDKVLIVPTTWGPGEPVPTLKESRGLGAGDVEGTLREYAVLVR